MKKFLLLLCTIACSYACSDDFDNSLADAPFCTEELVAGLKITVTSADPDFTADGTVVTAIDGSYSEILERGSNSNIFFGAYERIGSYTILVEKEGYQNYESSAPIEVDEDLCHVITESKDVVLIPN